MSEASRFTITLGRTGQVVKRDGTGLEGYSSARHPVVGSKKSVKDRLGVNGVSTQFKNKRLKGNGRMDNTLNDMHLSRDDLRHRIKRKHVVDLRSTMSRQAQSSSSTSSIPERDQSRDQKDNRIPYSDSIDSRQQRSTVLHGTQDPHHGLRDYVHQQRSDHEQQLMHDKREAQRRLPQLDDHRAHLMGTLNDRPLFPVTKSSTQSVQEYRRQQIPDSTKELMLDTEEGGRITSQLDDRRAHLPNANSVRKISQIHAPRATTSLTKPESRFDPYSPWTMDNLRCHSPEESLPSSLVTRDAELQTRYGGRTYGVAKTSTYISKDGLELSRPASSPYLSKNAPAVGSKRTLASANAAPPPIPTSFAQKSSYPVEDVQGLLYSLGLEKYSALFKVEEVDMYTLRQMTEIDLKSLGLPMGPRKKILLALQSFSRRQV